MRVVPLTLAAANRMVESLHRHHKPVRGHRFSLGLIDVDGNPIGALIAGRPVARGFDPTQVLEVNRLVTDGSRNACSILYGAAARAAKAMGFASIVTYTLPSEGGASLRGAGWTLDGQTQGGSWHSAKRPRRDKAPLDPKSRWIKTLNQWEESC